MVEHAELEGELFVDFVTDTALRIAELRGRNAVVRRIADVGCGPGVGTCELARRFPDASVVAVDSSSAMLERTIGRSLAHGLDDRISVYETEVPDGLDRIAPVDVIWASMSLHHIGDEVAALRALRALLEPDGLIAVAEIAEPMRVLPDDLDLGRPGLSERVERAAAAWFTEMRNGLPGSVPSQDLTTMIGAAGLEVVDSRLVRMRFDPPLSDLARRVALGYLPRARTQFAGYLDNDDRDTIDVLLNDDDPRSVVHRRDVYVAASRRIVIARPQ